MTAIAAITKGGQTWIGSDGKTFKGSIYFDSGPKFIKRKGWAVAHCDRAAAWQIIEMSIEEFKPPAEMNMAGVYAFGQWVKKKLIDHGVKKEAASNDELPSHPLEMLVATAAGGLFTVHGDGHVSQHEGFVASGAGWQLLIGSLTILHPKRETSAKNTLRRALEVSVEHSHYCEKPLHLARVR